MMMDFGKPFLLNVLKRGRRNDTKADKKDVGLRVGKRTQSIVIFLTYRPSIVESMANSEISVEAFFKSQRQTSGIKETQSVRRLSNHHSDGIIIKDLKALLLM